MQPLDLPHTLPVNYDPKHVISQRRLECRRAAFEHTQPEAWMGEANSLLYDQIWNSEPLKEIVEERGHINFAQSRNIQGKEEQVSSKKRSKSEVTEMDVDDSEILKKQKVTGEAEVIDLDLIKEPTITPTIIQEEVPRIMNETAVANPEESNKLPPV